MTKQDLLAGKTFKYNGHFNRLTNKKLAYNAGQESITDSADDITYWIDHISDSKFIAQHRKFGKIPILLKECTLEAVTA